MSWTKDFEWDLMLISFFDSHKWENIKEDNSLFFIELRKESLEPKYKSSKSGIVNYEGGFSQNTFGLFDFLTLGLLKLIDSLTFWLLDP